MNKRGSGAAWAVAALAILALAGSLVWGFSLKQQAQSLNDTVAQSQEKAMALTESAAKQDAKIASLEQTISQLEQRLAAAGSTQPQAGAADANSAGSQGAAQGQQAAENANPMANMFKMFEGEQGKKFAESSAEAALSMQYAELFTELALPPETEQKVRGIIRDFMVRGMMTAAEVMKNGDKDSAKKFEDDLEAEMRAELAKVLTPEGMAIYDEYEATAAERMLRKSFEMQLGMFASGLTAENRAMVLDVMVEEMMALEQEPGSLAAMADSSGVKGQLDALDRSRQRLSTVLDEQQMTQVDGFIQQTRTGIEMFMNMVSSQNKPAEQQPEQQENK